MDDWISGVTAVVVAVVVAVSAPPPLVASWAVASATPAGSWWCCLDCWRASSEEAKLWVFPGVVYFVWDKSVSLYDAQMVFGSFIVVRVVCMQS